MTWRQMLQELLRGTAPGQRWEPNKNGALDTLLKRVEELEADSKRYHWICANPDETIRMLAGYWTQAAFDGRIDDRIAIEAEEEE